MEEPRLLTDELDEVSFGNIRTGFGSSSPTSTLNS